MTRVTKAIDRITDFVVLSVAVGFEIIGFWSLFHSGDWKRGLTFLVVAQLIWVRIHLEKIREAVN